MGLPTGHNGVWVSGVELHSQDHLIGGLKQQQSLISHLPSLTLTSEVNLQQTSQLIKQLITLISAILDFFCQSHTVSMWSLQSSMTLRCCPES